MFMRYLAAAAAIATVAAAATNASAHPRLMLSNPRQGAVLKNSPGAIRMDFSEGLVPRFTGIALTDSHGGTVATGPASVSGPESTRLVVPLRAQLKPGTYNVAWHAVSVDTHRVSGKYSFKIAR
jgi:methionine-rich copper-binding protein CopC